MNILALIIVISAVVLGASLGLWVGHSQNRTRAAQSKKFIPQPELIRKVPGLRLRPVEMAGAFENEIMALLFLRGFMAILMLLSVTGLIYFGRPLLLILGPLSIGLLPLFLMTFPAVKKRRSEKQLADTAGETGLELNSDGISVNIALIADGDYKAWSVRNQKPLLHIPWEKVAAVNWDPGRAAVNARAGSIPAAFRIDFSESLIPDQPRAKTLFILHSRMVSGREELLSYLTRTCRAA